MALRRWKGYIAFDGGPWEIVCQVSSRDRARQRLGRVFLDLYTADMPIARGMVTGPSSVDVFQFQEPRPGVDFDLVEVEA